MAGSNDHALPFEAPLRDLKNRIDELMKDAGGSSDLENLLLPMQEQYKRVEKQLYENLSPWNTVELARHPNRPQTRDYLDTVFDDFEELHGDRAFRDDLSIVTGLATIGDFRVMVVGQHKGRNVEERHVCHAGCPHPEGYRKALRKMQMADKFGLPIVTLIDTKGAYPGIGSEERGVAIAIAENLREMFGFRVPIVCAVIGEGGSGGALGIAVGNRMLMLRHAYYSVISPEGCASILWRDGEKKADAANVLKLTSRHLLDFKLIDEIVDEPLGGAHRDPAATAKNLREAIINNLKELSKMSADELREDRYAKFRNFGRFLEGQSLPTMETEKEEPEAEKKTESAAVNNRLNSGNGKSAKAALSVDNNGKE